jgi:hypothetical protein
MVSHRQTKSPWPRLVGTLAAVIFLLNLRHSVCVCHNSKLFIYYYAYKFGREYKALRKKNRYDPVLNSVHYPSFRKRKAFGPKHKLFTSRNTTPRVLYHEVNRKLQSTQGDKHSEHQDMSFPQKWL